MFPVYSITHPQEQSLRYSTQGYSACLHSKTILPALEFVQIGCGFVLKQYKRKNRPLSDDGRRKQNGFMYFPVHSTYYYIIIF